MTLSKRAFSNKEWGLIIGVTVLVIGALIGYGGMTQQVLANKDDVKALKKYTIQATVNATEIQHVKQEVQEIKTDVREIRKDQKEILKLLIQMNGD
jgi:hypothetical protein